MADGAYLLGLVAAAVSGAVAVGAVALAAC